MEAWKYIVQNWGCYEWKPLPEWVKKSIGLRADVGIANFSLVTYTGYKGMVTFINNMRNKQGA